MTYTLIARCSRTGSFGIGIATYSLAVGSKCPAIGTNLGAIATQAFVNPTFKAFGLRMLGIGYPAVAIAAPKVWAAVNNPASAIAAWASEPMTPSSELRLRFDEGDQFINTSPFAAAMTWTVNEAQAAGLDNVLDTGIFLIAAAPADFAGYAGEKRWRAAGGSEPGRSIGHRVSA